MTFTAAPPFASILRAVQVPPVGGDTLWAAESARLLTMLFDVINRPDHQVRLRWERDTVAFWDNRATRHSAVAGDPNHRRVMHRVTVGQDART